MIKSILKQLSSIQKNKNQFVGYQPFTIDDSFHQIQFKLNVFFPTDQKSTIQNFGPYLIDVATQIDLFNQLKINKKLNVKVAIVSHGDGGNHWPYRQMIFSLVKSGYVVIAPEHYKNNRQDNSLSHTKENLIYRPLHLQLSLDFIEKSIKNIDSNFQLKNVLAIGHSMGGYSVLALAGGKPWWSMLEPLTLQHEKDHRLSHLVLLAPATGWFANRNSLTHMNCELLLINSEFDEITTNWQTQLIKDYWPKNIKLDYKLVKNGNHFSFLTPFPLSMKTETFLPAHDRKNFNRNKFQQKLCHWICEFQK